MPKAKKDIKEGDEVVNVVEQEAKSSFGNSENTLSKKEE
jgi:hypothetical protein